MNTVITFTLKDLLLSGLYLSLIALIIYIIRILMKANASMKIINQLVKDNRENIDKILDQAPGISKNVNDISAETSRTLKKFRGTIDNISETSESVTEVIKENNNLVDSLTSIFHTASLAKNAYDKYLGKEKENINTNNLSDESTKENITEDKKNSQ